MIRSLFATALMVQASAVAAATDFGVRSVPSESGGRAVSVSVERHGPMPLATARPATTPLATTTLGRTDLNAAARIGVQWGRVTSMRRSPGHNRRVGGVRNSFHLAGRAIDIARRAGVRHADIAVAFRRAGFQLIESLDEGDHSHFAFGSARPTRLQPMVIAAQAQPHWKIVFAPAN